MMKRMLVAGGIAMLLAACGGQDTRTPVVLGQLVVPASAPWLTVEQSSFDLPVRGLDQSLVLNPSPSVTAVLQSQLRHALQSDYFTDLVVGCDGVKADMRVDQDATPNSVGLELSTHCTINARGFVYKHDYRVQPSMPVPADGDYRGALTSLLGTGSKDLADQLTTDVAASKAKLR
jgi:hypothetical protein